MIVINQTRDVIARFEQIHLKGTKIKGISLQDGIGVTIAKYDSKERAESVFRSIIQSISSNQLQHIVLEMPVE